MTILNLGSVLMNIVILSRNPALYSTHSLYMAARRRGHSVRIVDHMRCDLKISNSRLEVFYQSEPLRDIDAVIPRIGASATSYGAAVIRQLEFQGIFSVVRSEALLRSRDKRSCLQFLVANGIPVPDTMATSDPLNIPHAINRLGSDAVVIKLLSGTHGIGVIKADDANTAESIIEGFLRLKQKIILQKFIEESKGRDIRVFIVDGQVAAAMERVAQEGDFRSNLHRGAVAQRVYLTRQEIDIAREAAHVMKLKVAGVDLLRTDSGPMVLEVNASPGLEGIEGVTGVDIAGKIIQFAERNVRRKR